MDSTIWKYTYILALIAFSSLSFKQIHHHRDTVSATSVTGALSVILILNAMSVCLNIMFDFLSQFDHHQTRGIYYLGLLFALASLLLWNDLILRKSYLPKMTSHFLKLSVGEEKLLITITCFSAAQWCLVPNYILGPSALICILLILLFRASAEQR